MFSQHPPHLAVLGSEENFSSTPSPSFPSGTPPPTRSSRGKRKGKGVGHCKGKGKGKGKGNRSRSASRDSNNRFSATVTCHACGKRRHYANNCWSKNQNTRNPSRSRSSSQSSRASTRPSPPGLVNPTPNFNSNFNQSFTPSDSSTNFNSKKRKVDTVHLLQQSAIYFDLMVNGKWVQAIVDTGASVCVVGAHLVDPSQISRKSAVPIQVANGAQVFSLGTTELTLNMNGALVRHPALVMETP